MPVLSLTAADPAGLTLEGVEPMMGLAVPLFRRRCTQAAMATRTTMIPK